MKAEFDIQRVIFDSPEDCYEPMYIADPILLTEALRIGYVKLDDIAQSIRINGVTYAFSYDEVSYYHVAQISKQPHLMLTHCVVCNGGTCFSPVVNGVYHHFSDGGLYNSMTILRDEETGSLWHHITGVCLHGPQEGTRLKSYGTAVVTTFFNVLKTDPNARLVSQPLNNEQRSYLEEDRYYLSGDTPEFWDDVAPSVLAEDTRLPRMTMGLGVWIDNEACFYPVTSLHNSQNAQFDRLGNRQIIIYTDGTPQFPRAFYTNADTVSQTHGRFSLSNGWSMFDGLVYGAGGDVIQPEYPRQFFARWFGFSLSFPNCRIYKVPNN